MWNFTDANQNMKKNILWKNNLEKKTKTEKKHCLLILLRTACKHFISADFALIKIKNKKQPASKDPRILLNMVRIR